MLVLHKCDTPHCVNPDHLFLGTDKDNTDDKIAKGRGYWLSGEDNPSAIMTKEGVAELRQLRQGGVIYRELAERFGISKSTARAIASGKIWPPAKDTPDEGMVYQQE